PPPWTSSARYRANLYTADGVQILRGWHDDELDFDCTSLQLAMPGGCPPSTHVFFSDDACSRPVVIEDQRAMPLPYYQSVAGFFHVTSPDQRVIEEFFVDGTGGCRDNHTAAKGYQAEKVDAATFVMREPVTHDLYSVEFTALESVDGSQEIIDVQNSLLVTAPSIGRLEVREHLNGGIRAIAAGDPLFDRMLGQNCHPALDTRAAFRCALDSSAGAPPRKLTRDSTCKSGFTPASLSPGYIIDETLSPVDGIGILGLLHSRCFDNQTGPWFELDGPACNNISETAYLCTTFTNDEFAPLDVDRE
ncbi:MAG TPA: hypothetical protein VGO00_21790, partial [Kofleriaceae bacterium]|nr:hypothetical protein [Kofleriaceae bacterium]